VKNMNLHDGATPITLNDCYPVSEGPNEPPCDPPQAITQRSATSSAGLQRNMIGSFTNVNITAKSRDPNFVVQENATVTTAGSTPALTNAPPELVTTPPGLPCGSNPEKLGVGNEPLGSAPRPVADARCGRCG
jgi:hypothetical protein